MSNAKGFRWTRLLEATAWLSLLAAFVIGQLAAQVDYQALLRKQLPGAQLFQYRQQDLDLQVYLIGSDDVDQAEAVIIAEGQGYSGPMLLGVRAAKTVDGGARVKEVMLLGHKDTPTYMKRLLKRHYYRQFVGKSVSDHFVVGDDIDGVSGATISSQGVAKAVRQVLHQAALSHLQLVPTWPDERWHWGLNESLLLALFAVALVGAYRRDVIGKYARRLSMIGALLFVGFYANASISIGSLAGIVLGYIPDPKDYPIWWLMMIGTLGSVLLLGRNLYCHQICAFKVVQDLLSKFSGIKLKLRSEQQRLARGIIFFLGWLSLMLIFLSTHPALGAFEPFGMMFSLQGAGIQWYLLPATLIGSLFVPSFFCRLLCPVGLYLNELMRLRRKLRDKLLGKPATVKAESVRLVEPGDVGGA